MNENIKTAGVGLVGLGLLVNAAVLLPENENPQYTKNGDKIAVERTICDPYTFVGTKEDMVRIANGIQANIDAQKILGVDIDQKAIDMLERYKARFIEDATEADKLAE